jgi:hypothetical protein
MEERKDICEGYERDSVQQLDKLAKDKNERFPIYPLTYIQAVYDARTKERLDSILWKCNNVYLPWMGSAGDTRIQLPFWMRRKGIIITYKNLDEETITEKLTYDLCIADDFFRLDSSWTRITDALPVGGNITIGSNGNWFQDGVDTGFKAQGPKGDNGLTPMLRTVNNKLQYSYDGEVWNEISEYIAAWFRFQDNKIQISRDQKTWSDLSKPFTQDLYIKGYVATSSALPSTGVKQGDIYMVGPTYAAEDTEHKNPIYRMYVYNDSGWVDNGVFQSIAAGVVQTIGNSETEVMSQKAVSSIVGLDTYPVFSDTKPYVKGEIVNYGGLLYEFTADHEAGAWIGTDVVESSLKKDIIPNIIYNISAVTKKFDYATFREAAKLVPVSKRFPGMMITYCTPTGWQIWKLLLDDTIELNNYNFAEVIKNWVRIYPLTSVMWERTSTLSSVNFRMEDYIKIVGIHTSDAFTLFTSKGLKRFYIKYFGRIGEGESLRYRVGIFYNDGADDVSIGTTEILSTVVKAMTEEEQKNIALTIKGNDIVFNLIVNLSEPQVDDNHVFTVDQAALNPSIISAFQLYTNKGDATNITFTAYNEYWEVVPLDLTLRNTYCIKLSFPKASTGANGSFGLNLFGIIDPNYAIANKSIRFTRSYTGLNISRSDTGQTFDVIVSDTFNVECYIKQDSVTAWIYVNGIYCGKWAFEGVSNKCLLFQPTSETWKTLDSVDVVWINDVSFAEKSFVNNLTTNKLVAKSIINNDNLSIDSFTESKCKQRGIELVSGEYNTAGAIYKLPLGLSAKFRMKFDFKANFNMNAGEPRYIKLLDIPVTNVSWNQQYDKLFNIYLIAGKPTNKTLSVNNVNINCTIPEYNSGVRVTWGSDTNNAYVDHIPDDIATKAFRGEDAFSIRFTGDPTIAENQDLIISNDGTEIKIKHELATSDIAVFVLRDYSTLNDLYNAIKEDANLTDFEFDFRCISQHLPSDLLLFEKIYFCQEIPNGNVSPGGGFAAGSHWDAFPVYLPLNDEKWHTVEIYIDGDRATDTLRATLDGIYKFNVYRPAPITDIVYKGVCYIGGDSDGNSANISLRNLQYDLGETSSFSPHICVTVMHHLVDEPDGYTDPMQGAYYSGIGKIITFVEKAINKGWKPITLEQLDDYIYGRNEKIPNKSLLLTFDDSIVELFTNDKFRGLFSQFGIKPTTLMISKALDEDTDKIVSAANNAGYSVFLHDFTHNLYIGCYKYSELGAHLEEGRKMMLDRWGIFCDKMGNNFEWGTPMSSKVQRDHGFSISFGATTSQPMGLISKGSNPYYMNRINLQYTDDWTVWDDLLGYCD